MKSLNTLLVTYVSDAFKGVNNAAKIFVLSARLAFAILID
jgi:hypothetical protein